MSTCAPYVVASLLEGGAGVVARYRAALGEEFRFLSFGYCSNVSVVDCLYCVDCVDNELLQ